MGGVALIFVLNFIFSPPLVAFIHARARWFLANNYKFLNAKHVWFYLHSNVCFNFILIKVLKHIEKKPVNVMACFLLYFFTIKNLVLFV